VVLRASLLGSDNTAANRKAISWVASSGTRITVSPSDPLAVSISRGTSKKVQLGIKLKGARVKDVVLWIVWCELAGHLTGSSSLDSEILGWSELRAEVPDPKPRFEVQGKLDWLMTITPPEVITDVDRPALEKQTPVPPPGQSVAPSPFFAWDVATDTRVRTSEIIPPSAKVILGTNVPYKWSASGAEGESGAPGVKTPYEPGTPGWASRVRTDPFEDSVGKNGQIAGFHTQSRVAVRVQLGSTWYRCSSNHRNRFRASAKRSGGKWKAEPGTKPVLELNNDNWAKRSPLDR
jgi:hypothetical protein